MASKFYDKPFIGTLAADGTPMVYAVLNDDGTQTPITREQCLAHDDLGAPPLYVDEESGLVIRLPRTEQGEQLARENMRYLWRQQKIAQRHDDRYVSLDTPILDPGIQPHHLIHPVDTAELVETTALMTVLIAALDELPEADRQLIEELFWAGKSDRQLASEMGFKSHKSVGYRKNKVLAKLAQVPALKSFFEDSAPFSSPQAR